MRAFGRALGNTFGAFGKLIWGFMVIFSFVVNLILVGVLLILLLLLFNIKNDIADPLLKGLHSSFVGLDEATIDWTIPVRDSVQAQFTLPLQQNTVVVLTDNVPLVVQADISGPVSISNATVALTLPTGTRLPVALDLQVPVDETIPVELNVRAVIPLSETQLHDPFDNLRYTFEPLILALENLPSNFGDAGVFATEILAGQPRDLFDPSGSEYAQDPWVGFSRTAGIGYELLELSRQLNAPGDLLNPSAQAANSGTTPNVFRTGIIPLGGIPALDAFVREELYTNEQSPAALNAATEAQLEQMQVPQAAFSGGFDTLPGTTIIAPSDGNTGAPPNTEPPPAAPAEGAIGGVSSPTDSGALVPGTPQPAFTVVPPSTGG